MMAEVTEPEVVGKGTSIGVSKSIGGDVIFIP